MKYLAAIVGIIMIAMSILLYAMAFMVGLLWVLNILELFFGNIFFNVMDGTVQMDNNWLLLLRVVGIPVAPLGIGMAFAF